MRSMTLLLVAIPFLSLYGQDITKKHAVVTKRVTQINQDKSMTPVILRNEEFLAHDTDGGGELTGYFKNGEIQKITKSIGLSHGMEVYEYYFTQGKLIYVHETFNGFVYNEKTAAFDYSKTERNFIGRYYFKNNKLIDLETTGHNRFEDDSIDIEATLIKEMTDCLNKITNRKKK